MTEPGPSPTGKRKFGKMEALILLPNLVLVGGILFYLAASGLDQEKVEPLVSADPQLSAHISSLEAALSINPGDLGKAIELSRLYQDMGEFPWSYNALVNAEKNGGDDPGRRLKLGLAYLELGKNLDGQRVIQEASESCKKTRCPPGLSIKLDLFSRVADAYVARKIDTRRDRIAADKILDQVFKPVKVDPAKMQPKAPASPVEQPPAAPPAKS